MLTLLDISTPRFQTATGYCPGSPEFLEVVNDAVQELIRRGDWSETLLPIRVCVKNGCVTWPRYVGAVRKMNGCRHSVNMRNVWYEFLDYHMNHRHHHEWEGWCGEEENAEMQYKAPTYNDIYGLNCTVRLYVDLQADVGATVTIFGTDNNNQPLQTDNGDGTFSPGVIITAAMPYGSTSTFVSKIDRVVCSATQGLKRLYAYDSVQNALFDLAVYDPGETNPSYLRYQLRGRERQASCNGGAGQTIIALVKLAALPMVYPTDLCIINNRGALLDAIRAIKAEDASSPLAGGYWKSAVERLNRQLEDDDPTETFSAQNNVLGTRVWRNRCF